MQPLRFGLRHILYLHDFAPTERDTIRQQVREGIGAGKAQLDGEDLFVGYRNDRIDFTIGDDADPRPIDNALQQRIVSIVRPLCPNPPRGSYIVIKDCPAGYAIPNHVPGNQTELAHYSGLRFQPQYVDTFDTTTGEFISQADLGTFDAFPITPGAPHGK